MQAISWHGSPDPCSAITGRETRATFNPSPATRLGPLNFMQECARLHGPDARGQRGGSGRRPGRTVHQPHFRAVWSQRPAERLQRPRHRRRGRAGRFHLRLKAGLRTWSGFAGAGWRQRAPPRSLQFHERVPLAPTLSLACGFFCDGAGPTQSSAPSHTGICPSVFPDPRRTIGSISPAASPFPRPP